MQLNGRTQGLMAKAKTQQKKSATKKTHNKKAEKTPKKSTNKSTETAVVTTKNKGGRPLFDGKDEEVVCTKLKTAFMGGASKLQASIIAGISHTALDRYFEKNPEFRAICEELSEIPLIAAHAIQNRVMAECEKRDDVYDEDGNKIEYVPSARAINASKLALRARDARYAAKSINANFDIPPVAPHSGLTPEREAEIGEALRNWGQPEPEAYEVK